MKKFIKVCLCLALVFAIIGATGCAIGAGLGANKTVFADTVNNDTVVTNLTGMVDKLVDECSNWEYTWEFGDWNGDGWIAWDKYTKEQTKEYTFTADQVEELEASLKAGDFRYAKSGSEQVEVTVKSKNRKIEVNNSKDGVLTIEDKGRADSSKKSSYIIQVAVPDGFSWNTMDVASSAGDLIFMTDLLCEEELKVKASAGDLDAGNMKAENMDITLSAGDCDIEGTIEGDLELTMSAGDCSIDGTLRGNLDLSSSAGDADLTLEGSRRDYNYNITSSVCGFSVGDQDYDNSLNNKLDEDNDAEYTIQAHSSAGDLSIDFE